MQNTRAKRIGAFAFAAALAAIAGACSDTAAPVAPSPAESSTAIKGEPNLGAAMAAVRAATAKYHDVDRAIAAGYLNPAVGTCDQIPAGTMGIHAGNPALMGNQQLDPENPEVLLYLPTGNGYRLVAVEWVQPVLLKNKTSGVVAPWFAPTQWDPAEYDVITPTPQLFGHTFQGPMAGHVAGMPWHWDLHAWIWANNPNGMFEPWNPAISCQ